MPQWLKNAQNLFNSSTSLQRFGTWLSWLRKNMEEPYCQVLGDMATSTTLPQAFPSRTHGNWGFTPTRSTAWPGSACCLGLRPLRARQDSQWNSALALQICCWTPSQYMEFWYCWSTYQLINLICIIIASLLSSDIFCSFCLGTLSISQLCSSQLFLQNSLSLKSHQHLRREVMWVTPRFPLRSLALESFHGGSLLSFPRNVFGLAC